MPLLADTWTGTQDPGDPLDGVANMGYFSAVRAVVNALDNANIAVGANIDGAKLADATIANAKLVNNTIEDGKLLWAHATNGVKAMRTTASQRKELWGRTAFTVGIGTDEVTVAVDFTTHGADAPTDFANATDLVVVASLEYTLALDTEELICDVNTITATGFNCVVRTAASGVVAANRTGFIHWHAIGRTA